MMMEEIKFINPDRDLLERINITKLEKFYFPLTFPLSDITITFEFPKGYRYKFLIYTDKLLPPIFEGYFVLLGNTLDNMGIYQLKIPKSTLISFYTTKELISPDKVKEDMKILEYVYDTSNNIVNYLVEVIKLNPFKSFLYSVLRISEQGEEFEILTGKFEIKL